MNDSEPLMISGENGRLVINGIPYSVPVAKGSGSFRVDLDENYFPTFVEIPQEELDWIELCFDDGIHRLCHIKTYEEITKKVRARYGIGEHESVYFDGWEKYPRLLACHNEIGRVFLARTDAWKPVEKTSL